MWGGTAARQEPGGPSVCHPSDIRGERSHGFCLTILPVAHRSPSHLLTLPRPEGLCFVGL